MSDSKSKTGPALVDEAWAIMSSCPTDEELAADPDAEERWSEQVFAWCDAADQKAERYRAVVLAAQGREASFKQMAAAYIKAAKREARTAEKVEQLALLLLRSARLTTGAAEARCSDGTTIAMKVRKSTRVEVLDEARLPEHLFRVKREPNIAEIRARLKGGEEIEGAELQQHKKEVVSWGL